MDKVPALNAVYLDFLANYAGMEVTSDIDLFGYEEALRENLYLAESHPDIAAELWQIGRTGQDQ